MILHHFPLTSDDGTPNYEDKGFEPLYADSSCTTTLDTIQNYQSLWTKSGIVSKYGFDITNGTKLFYIKNIGEFSVLLRAKRYTTAATRYEMITLFAKYNVQTYEQRKISFTTTGGGFGYVKMIDGTSTSSSFSVENRQDWNDYLLNFKDGKVLSIMTSDNGDIVEADINVDMSFDSTNNIAVYIDNWFHVMQDLIVRDRVISKGEFRMYTLCQTKHYPLSENPALPNFGTKVRDVSGFGNDYMCISGKTYESVPDSARGMRCYKTSDNGLMGFSGSGGYVWRTMTAEEWTYLATGRSDARNKKFHCRILDENAYTLVDAIGFIPDDMTVADIYDDYGISIDTTQITSGQSYGVYNTFVVDEYVTLSNAGIIFLPASGNRKNGSTYTSSESAYWTSTGNTVMPYSYIVFENTCRSKSRNYQGLSVRLVRDTAETTHSFSVSSSKKVYFSQGNLQYKASTDEWRFAENQYNYVGDTSVGNVYENGTKCSNTRISSSYDGWIDLFGYGCNGYNAGQTCYQPYSVSNQTIDYLSSPLSGTKSDFGNVMGTPDISADYISFWMKIDDSWHFYYKNGDDKYVDGVQNASGFDDMVSYVLSSSTYYVSDVRQYAIKHSAKRISRMYSNPVSFSKLGDGAVVLSNEFTESIGYGYRTLTYSEASYLIKSRTNSSSLCGYGNIVVGGVTIKGMFILPDDWSAPAGISFTPTYNDFTTNSYSEQEWSSMENAGAVFLPFCGLNESSGYKAERSLYWLSSQLTVNHGRTFYIADGINPLPSNGYLFKNSNAGVRLVANTDSATHSFSVSDTKKVYFSKGNLQYKASTAEWRFAEHQYDFVGNTSVGNVYENGVKCSNTLISSSYDGWIDLFAWGCDGYNNGQGKYEPYSIGGDISEYYQNNISGTQSDWGERLSGMRFFRNGVVSSPNFMDYGVGNRIYRLMTYAEFSYFFTNYASHVGVGKVTVDNVDVYGGILTPDNFVVPAGCTFDGGKVGEYYSLNEYTQEQWISMENAGARFLPVTHKIYVDSSVLYSLSTYQNNGFSSVLFYNLNNNFTRNIIVNQASIGFYNSLAIRLVEESGNGAFSVSENKKVNIAKSNLMYRASTNEWKFAENSWDFVGNDSYQGNIYEMIDGTLTRCSNTNASSTYEGWIDVFPWGCSGWNSGAVCYLPYDNPTLPTDVINESLVGDYANADAGVYNMKGEKIVDAKPSLHKDGIEMNDFIEI